MEFAKYKGQVKSLELWQNISEDHVHDRKAGFYLTNVLIVICEGL